MKKKILGGMVAVAIAAVAAWNVNIDKEGENSLSALSLANVEALASGESGNGYSCSVSKDCGAGSTVSCTGVVKCEFVSGPLGSQNGRGVKCDGNVTRCP